MPSPVGAFLFVPSTGIISAPPEAPATNPGDQAKPSTAISHVDKLDLEIVRDNDTEIITAMFIHGGESTEGNVMAHIPDVAGAIAVACNDDEHLRTAFNMVQKHSSTGVVRGIVFSTGKACFDYESQRPNVTISRGGIELLSDLGIMDDALYDKLTPLRA